MAEVINLATFNLDTDRLQKSLSDLQDSYLDLKKEQKSYSDQVKETAKQIDLLEKANDALSDSAGDNSDAIEANRKEIESLIRLQREAQKAELNLASSVSRVRTEISQTTTQLTAYQNAEGRTTSLIELGNNALRRQINNRNDARSSSQELNRIVSQLNPNIEEEAQLMQQLNSRIDDNTSFVRANSSATTQQAMNIGNYTADIEEALKSQELFNGGLLGFIKKSSDAGGAGALLGNAFSAIRIGILGALKAGLAFIATPIGAVIGVLAVSVGAVVGAFKLAKASMQSTEEGTQRLAVITGAITGVFNGLFKIIKPLGMFFAEVFIKTLENVGTVAEKVSNGLANVLEFVGAESAAKGIRNITNEVKQSSIASANLAKAEGELQSKQRNGAKIQLDYQRQAEKLRQQRDDETKSISERIRINNQLGGVLQKQSASELEIANKQLQVANLKILAEGKTTDSLNARAEAEKNISDIKERITGQESEQLANLNSLRKESADKKKELDSQSVDSALSKSRSEIDLFIASQGFKKKSIEEEIKLNNQLYDKELVDLKLQLENKKITQEQFDAQLKTLQNENMSKNASLTIENAQLELDAQTEKNNKILENDQYLSDEQLKIKQKAIADQLKADTDYELVRLVNGDINQKQYDDNIAKIKNESKEKADELNIQNEVAEKEKQLIDLENKKIIEEENFIAQGELEKERNAIKLQQELDNAEKTGADTQLIKDKYAQMDKDIDSVVMQNKLNLASQTFGQLATILGENSKAGKAAAIAQATIDTYSGINKVWSTASTLPEPLATGQKILSTVIVAKSGFDSVKKITSTKQPNTGKPSKFASGVIGLRGTGFGESDSISASLSAGESVINARSTSMFAKELGIINQAGGGVGLNGASNILNQNEINQNVNNSQMVQMIAEAVAIGAEQGTSKGSQKGIIGLSENRKIMNDAKF
jgi:hypothetical protein